MSIMAESNVYESMVDDGLNEKLCLAACEASNTFMFIPKIERNVEQTMDHVSEEIAMEKTGMLHDGIIQDPYDGFGHHEIYYEEAFSACEEVEVEYKPSITSMIIPDKMETQWESAQFENSAMDSSFEDNQAAVLSYHDESENVEDSDEETIATFLTSAGQRLALYAVEDSDEVFAVAVYDESGEPPTNFQFLLKADVERLIGEGAVRTVKKPTQMKRQHFSTDTPLFAQNTEEPTVENFEQKFEPIEHMQYQNEQYDTHNTTCSDVTDLSNTEIVQETERISSPLPEPDKLPDITYVVTDDACPILDQIEEKAETTVTDADCDSDDFIEQSTVQYILLGEDESDGELTLADIEETLKIRRKPSDSNKSLLKKTLRRNVDSAEEHQSLNGLLASEGIREDPEDVKIPVVTEDYTARSFKSASKLLKPTNPTRKSCSSLICRRESLIDERFNVSSGSSLLIPKSESKSLAESSGNRSEIAQIVSRVKRSRKQQLTSVNRDDSEIIIQPASFPSEEEDEPVKKRGRGKRKPGRPAIHKSRKAAATKKVARSQRPRPVEVIEIDVDEADRLQAKKKEIVEIILDEIKEKGSSDKENEVIMVGDSDDEAKEPPGTSKSSTTSLLKCDYCLRSFRQNRALETHSQVCPKSPESLRRISEKAARRSSAKSNDSTGVKKQYPCKICQEKFDVVVALARHVRCMHSQRKKVNFGNRTPVKPPESPPKIEETPKTIQIEIVAPDRPKKKTKTRIKPSKRSWKSKKLDCTDCGRWFSSEALLTAHSLQHATRKSEKQTRRCPTCKKLFKSRLLYIRHMRMHSRAKQLQKKLHRTRQPTGKKAAMRKRGRPRKL